MKPHCFIFHTIKGHGVSYMENQLSWHYWPMTKDLYEKALKEIEEGKKKNKV
jgi:transketolase